MAHCMPALAEEEVCSGAVRLRDRPAHVHRLPRVHGGVQDRARGAGRAVPHLGEVRRAGATFPDSDARLRRHALQPLHRRAVRDDLPDEGAVQARRTASSTSTATAASAARAACRAARTTRSTSTRTPTPRPSATSARTGSTHDLEPACVVVCPTHSIWVGDLDDPDSGISTAGQHRTRWQVRTPEQNTGPNVFYLGAEPRGAGPARGAGGRQLRLSPPRRAPRGGGARCSRSTRSATRGPR